MVSCAFRLVLAAVVSGLTTWATSRGDDPPVSREQPRHTVQGAQDPTLIFLNAPADLSALLNRMAQPDFVLLEWAGYQELFERAARADANIHSVPRTGSIKSTLLRGIVENEVADLALELVANVASDEPALVPIGLAGLVLSEAREGTNPLQVSGADPGGWQVRLVGRGEHRFDVRFRMPIRSTPDRKRLELSIPESPSTRIDLSFVERPLDARSGDGEPLSFEPSSHGAAGRLSAQLTPRSRLELSWNSSPLLDSRPKPMLAATVEMALDVAPGLVTSVSTYELRCSSGSLEFVTLSIDPGWERLSVEVDGRAAPIASSKTNTGLTTLKVAVPVRPDSARKLVLRAQHALASDASRWSFHGFPLEEADTQTGLIAVARQADLTVVAQAKRGLRQLDHRTELPSNLRVDPAVIVAYQFLEQPFDLELELTPTIPWVRVESRTTALLEESRVSLNTWLAYRVARSRLFHIDLQLPEGFVLEDIGPPEVIDSSEMIPNSEHAGRFPQVLRIHLKENEPLQGTFRLQVLGHLSLSTGRPAPIPLVRPSQATIWSGWLAVAPAINVSYQISSSGGFLQVPDGAPSDWTWPPSIPEAQQSRGAFLRFDGADEVAPPSIVVASHPMTVSASDRVKALVARHSAEIHQEFELSVRHGLLQVVELSIPGALVDSWQLEGLEIARREITKRDPDQGIVVRLELLNSVTKSARFELSGRLNWSGGHSGVKPNELKIPLFQIENAEHEDQSVSLTSEPGVEIIPKGNQWQELTGDALNGGSATKPRSHWMLDSRSAPLTAILTEVSAKPLVSLPNTVISRCWLHTLPGPDGSVQVRLRLSLERHAGELKVRLPADATWVRAALGDANIAEIQQLDEPSTFRVRIATGAKTPAVLALEYNIPRRSAGREWWGPRLLGGTVIESMLWQIEQASNWVVLGAPGGWYDENQWHWDNYSWKRSMGVSESALLAWVEGTRDSDSRAVSRERSSIELHSYLFRASGEPPRHLPIMVPRSLLVGFCSIGALIGVLALLATRPAWIRFALLALAFLIVVALAWLPLATFQVLQASLVGVALAVLALILHRWQRRGQSAELRAPGFHPEAAPVGSVTQPDDERVSDSTVIRIRQTNTIDHESLSKRDSSEIPLSGPLGG